MKKLSGKRIALLGSRKVEDMAKLVENLGGTAVSRPAQGTVVLNDVKLNEDVEAVANRKFDWVIFTTGIGVETLYDTALKIGLRNEFLSALENMKIAARGYKTVNMLKKLGLTPLVRDDDGSTAGLIRALSEHSLENLTVALQLHGDPAPALREWLEVQKAEHSEILPYVHTPPAEGAMKQLLNELLAGELDAAFFTSTPQVRNLFDFARKHETEAELKLVFSKNTIALAVGKVTAQVLYDEGIERVVYPENERIGSALVELSKQEPLLQS